MKSGSLVVYIGGQEQADIDSGYGLNEDDIYVVDKVGWFHLGYPPVKKRVISLVERPNEVHAIDMFREIQPPGTINFEELVKKSVETKEEKIKIKQN